MSAAFMTISVLAATTLVAAAQSPFNVVGEGLLTKPFSINGQAGKGVRYAGPVVYTNEKPPMIFFPPPPKDAKPGFGGLSIFGKNKAPKSIKYVPMPHHDLPVLIYTSDKMPPIHVVQPSNVDEGPSPFGHPREIVRPPTGSLSSVYRGILPEANSPRVVSSSYEIPSTSYGTPMKAYGSALGSLDLSSSVAATIASSAPTSNGEYDSAQPPVSNVVSNSIRTVVGSQGSNKKALPNILYSGQPPIHVFNHPEMFVQAPKEVPLKTFADMPPKASFGPPKSSYGPPSGNSFTGLHTIHRHHYRTLPSPSSFGSPYSRLSPPAPSREILIPSESSHSPSVTSPCSQKTPKAENNEAAASTSQATVQPLGKPPTYAFKPPQTMFSFGPFSIEYGPPEEPFMSYSEPEPTGSLTSLYGSINDGPVASANENTNVIAEQQELQNRGQQQEQQIQEQQQQQQENDEDGWIPGPPPEIPEEQIKEETWDAPMPPPLPPQPQQLGLRRPHFRGRPIPMHNSVLLPSLPHGFSPFGGSRLAHFLSAFKLKRSKPKYAIAPKSMHKPPITITTAVTVKKLFNPSQLKIWT